MADIFVDTSGFYAFLVKKDKAHDAARVQVRKAHKQGGVLWTTDYVLDETITLLKARGLAHLLAQFFDATFSSQLCRIDWMDSDRFFEVRNFVLKHNDQPWSFTDCFSFCVMKRRGLARALSKDSDYKVAGFTPLLPPDP